MILGIRHGERADASEELAEKARIELFHDPHLTKLGEFQAQITAKAILQKIENFEQELKLQNLFTKKVTPVIIASPFLRTIQTAYHIANNLGEVYENSIFIHDEIIEFLDDDKKFGFEKDPRPILFSSIMKLEDYKRYGMDFINGPIKIKKFDYSNPEFKMPSFPEGHENCNSRIKGFIENFPKIFFKKFKFNTFIPVWISHQYCLAAACWHLRKTNSIEFPIKNVGYCGILDLRYEDADGMCEKRQVKQWGSNDHINKL